LQFQEDFEMKKLMFLAVFALLAMSVAMAQTVPGATYGVAQSTDNLGAHNDGGRGCAGCHAPHSGGRGSRGTTEGTTLAGTGVNEGDKALWGTDLYPITSHTTPIMFADNGYSLTFAGGQELTSSGVGSSPIISGIAVCLSCHDGNISRGAMMTGISYEQAWGLLNFAQTAGLGNQGHLCIDANGNQTIASVTLYGTAPIPTLLGDDEGTPGDYTNDHPVGYGANIVALFSASAQTTDGISFGLTATNGLNVIVTAAGQYAQFVDNYGDPNLTKLTVDTTGYPGSSIASTAAFVTCTTCHNQHSMNIYSGTMGGVKGYYPTYFFIAAPYNPGAAWSPTKAPSTTQFCRQCHFSHANEAVGINNVGTAY